MPRNARTPDARKKLLKAVRLVAIFAATLSGAAASSDDDDNIERQQYAAMQGKMVQTARQINKNLAADLPAVTRQQEDAFNDAMRDGTRETDPQFEDLKAGLKTEFFKATDPAFRTNQQGFQALKTRVQSRILGRAGNGIHSRQERETFRQLVCNESLAILKELLQNNFQARSLAITLLPELQTVNPSRPDDPSRRILDEAADVLVEVLMDENQPDAVKLGAAQSIIVYLEKVKPGGIIEMKFATALSSELESWLPEDGYQFFLVEAMSNIRAARQVAGVKRRAIAIETLVNVMQDKRRAPVIRCRAAGALGSVGSDAQIKFEPLAWKTVQLAAEMGAAYNANPKSIHWNKCSEQLFLAFHQKGKDPVDGMLNRAPKSELVRGAYEQILPICLAILDSPPAIDAALLTNANGWAKANQPANLQFDAASPAVNP
jgi:hypothetical protein